MANRPFHELTERIASKRTDVIQRLNKKPSSDDVNRAVDNMLAVIGSFLISANPKTPEELKAFAEELKSKGASRDQLHDWVFYRTNASKAYATAYNAYSQITDIEKSAHRSERKSQIRAVFFRIVTTLGVGLSIMFIYWLADCWGISMPLSRKI